jgi:RimJ/RimL family protein N-acetyltransferase
VSANRHTNSLGQPIGFPLPSWQPRPRPGRTPLEGRFCRLEALDADRHASALFAANSDNKDGRNWAYLPYGPFERFEDYLEWVVHYSRGDDPLFYAVIARATGEAVGVASYLRIEPAVGCLEVGGINFSPRLQRRPAATEAMYLMMRRAFDELGYRRYEWKCDALNQPSRQAAERLGFTFEGVFRQATIYKGRNRDTAWYSIIDREWPGLKRAFDQWLDPANFDEIGRQERSLGSFRKI